MGNTNSRPSEAAPIGTFIDPSTVSSVSLSSRSTATSISTRVTPSDDEDDNNSSLQGAAGNDHVPDIFIFIYFLQVVFI